MCLVQLVIDYGAFLTGWRRWRDTQSANEAATGCREARCARVTHAFTRTRLRAYSVFHIKGSKQINSFSGRRQKMTRLRDSVLHGGALCAFLRTAARPMSSKKPASFPEFILIMSGMLLVLVKPLSAHPQCLDFEPPFKPPSHLEFCTQYEMFGCCDQDSDNTIAERYWDVIDQLDTAGHELCEDMLKEIMCQVCMLVCF